MPSFALPLASTLALVGALLPGQVLTIQGPAVPGALLYASVLNTLTVPISVNAPTLHLLSPGGDLIAPADTFPNDYSLSHAPGATFFVAGQVPAAGPGSSGSYVGYIVQGNGAVARVDVGAPSPGFPAIHAFNQNAISSSFGHVYGTGAAGPTIWRLANSSPSPFTFAAGDVINVFAPGGIAPLVAVPLQGLTVLPGAVIDVPLPLGALPVQSYTVETLWNDPVAGSISSRHGIRPPGQPVDLHLPGGHALPFGGSLPMRIRAFQGFYPVVQAPLYLVLAGVQPGSTLLPAGGALAAASVLPLVADELTIASAGNGLSGYLPGNVGALDPIGIPCGGCPSYWPPLPGAWETTAPNLIHPSLPGTGGYVLRLAVLVYDPSSNTWSASQPEEVTL